MVKTNFASIKLVMSNSAISKAALKAFCILHINFILHFSTISGAPLDISSGVRKFQEKKSPPNMGRKKSTPSMTFFFGGGGGGN